MDFHLLKTHLKDEHDKEAKNTDTYFIFRIDEASESIDVSVSQHLNQFEESTRLNLKEDPAWRPHELESSSDDGSTDSEPPIPKKKSVERPTSAKPHKCLFCGDFFRALQEFASAFPERPSSERQNCTESVPEMPSHDGSQR